MHKLLVIITGLTGAAMLTAQNGQSHQNLQTAVQQLNLDAVREIIVKKKYSEKERVQALQLLAPLLQEKSKAVPFYKNFRAQSNLVLGIAATYYITKKVIESVNFINGINADQRAYYARGDYSWRPPSPFTFLPHIFRAVYGGIMGIPLAVIYTFTALQQFNISHNPDYITALAINGVLNPKPAKTGN